MTQAIVLGPLFISVAGAESLNTQQMPGGVQLSPAVGDKVNAPLQVSGGQAPYHWSVKSGSLPTGLNLSKTGVLTGMVSTAGTWDSTVMVEDAQALTGTQGMRFAVNAIIPAAVLNIPSATLPTGTIGTAYSTSFVATGGKTPYTWFGISGSLPKGLSISTSGVLSGTPTQSGAFTFAVAVADSSLPAQGKSQTFTLTVNALPISITSTSLSSGTVGSAYSATLAATGGTPAYTWSLASGSLPTGLALSSSGVLSGTPTTAGTFNFSLAVTDTASKSQQQAYSVTIATPPLAITTTSLASGQVSTAYAASLAATGGKAPYTWSATASSLPKGLSLSSAGVLSGTPTQSGIFTVSSTVTDSSSPSQSKTQSLSLTIAATPLSISTSTLAGGTKGTAYSALLAATGGTPSYTWALASGSLPAGLTLSTAGALAGTPTASGTFTFTVSATDAGSPVQKQTKTLSLAITTGQLAISTTTLSNAAIGTAYSATLVATGGTASYTWFPISGSLSTGLSISQAGLISGTPNQSGTFTFTMAVTDSSVPVQAKTQTFSLTVTGSALSISTSGLSSAQVNTSYVGALQASGGTAAYTWSIASGSLPTGLSLSATTGMVSGTPTVSGTSSATVRVTDNSTPAQTATAAVSITVASATSLALAGGTSWFIRTDGGTRFSTDNQNGQCDGKADVAYPGSGVNQHCAFNDVRYMWMTGAYGNSQWVMAGGDTLVIRGCAALPSQQNPDAPNCRIGWDKATGNDSENFWCAGVSAWWGCTAPPVPSGTATQHTRILGGCAFGTYSCNPVKDYPYTNNNLTQLFGGFTADAVFYLNGSQYVDMQGLELTTHNGTCTRTGYPSYPSYCSTEVPKSDFAKWGIVVTNTTSNITFQDLYIHGFASLGIGGPLGGAFTLTRVSIDFNAFAGWNFDDGSSTPNAANATLTQSYVTMVGNGCLEEYPIVHTQFPAKSCWDSNSAGFGDAWSGQDSNLASFTCDHCKLLYNVKDAAMGPHTLIHNLSLTNSMWVGNMGQAGKWGQDSNATFLFQNNVMVGNCYRMSQTLPGAAQNFNQSTGLSGSYLTNFCRAAGSLFDYFAGPGSTVNIGSNTIITYQPTTFELGCTVSGGCSGTPYNFTDNLILGYTSPSFGSGQAPAVYYKDESSVTIAGSHNLEYGIRNGDTCGTNGNICLDPLLVNELAQGTVPPESNLDNVSFHLTPASPAINAGTVYSGSSLLDFYGSAQTTALTIGAVAP